MIHNIRWRGHQGPYHITAKPDILSRGVMLTLMCRIFREEPRCQEKKKTYAEQVKAFPITPRSPSHYNHMVFPNTKVTHDPAAC